MCNARVIVGLSGPGVARVVLSASVVGVETVAASGPSGLTERLGDRALGLAEALAAVGHVERMVGVAPDHPGGQGRILGGQMPCSERRH